MEGIYDGDVTFKELKQHGDFGIGTFNQLDGEMIGFDNNFYQVKIDGIAYKVDDSQKTPFAVVTFFEPDKTVFLDGNLNFQQLTEYLDTLIPTKNIFYAIKIDGNFKYMKTRSVPKQGKPYQKLADAVKYQSVFEFNSTKGTIIGFRTPEYANGINVPGYHLHFITEDKKAGGHVLDLITDKNNIEIDYTSNFYMDLLKSKEFYNLGLDKDKQEELEKIEK